MNETEAPAQHGILTDLAPSALEAAAWRQPVDYWHVGVAPAARRRGIGSVMTLAALEDGRRLGHRFGVRQVSDAGLSIYRKLGFREYGQALQHRWTPDS